MEELESLWLTMENPGSARNTVCATCLSTSRRLWPLREIMEVADLYVYVSNGIHLTHEDFVCWECKAVLLKFYRFRSMALKARDTLAASSWLQHQTSNQSQDPSFQSLSTLSLCKLPNIYIPTIYVRTYVKQEWKVDLETDKMVEDDKMVEIDKEFIDQQVKQEKEEDPDPPAEGSVDIDMELTVNQMSEKEEDPEPPAEGSVDIDSDTDTHMELTVNQMSEKEEDPDPPAEGLVDMVTNTKTHIEFTVKQMSEKEMRSFRQSERERFRYKNSPYKCEDCVKYFRNESAMSRHLQLHQENKAGLPCAVCSLRFRRQISLARHLQSHYSCYECTKCGYRNANRHAMLSHCWRHHKVTKCSTCKLEFISTVQLNAHLCRQSPREDVTCRSCGRGYRNKYQLRRHEAVIHSVDEMLLLECDVCYKKFRGEKRLKKHKSIHALNRADENAYCAECDVQFTTVYAYQGHLKTTARHVTPTDRKFECDACGKVFYQKNLLKVHILSVHLRKSDLVCPHCRKCFYRKDRLRDHIKFVHEGQEKVKDQKCTYCWRSFTTKAVLTNHIRVHTGEKPYSCEQCGMCFSQRSTMNTHVRGVHLKKRVSKS